MIGNERQFARAQQSIPGGVNSPVRAYGSVGGTPRSGRGAGGDVTDVEGREYVDLVIVGARAPRARAPAVVEAVHRAAAGRGLSFGFTHRGPTEIAELVKVRASSARDGGRGGQAAIEKLASCRPEPKRR